MTKEELKQLVRKTQTLELTDAERQKADGSFIDSVPPRSTVFHAQTPQSFLTARLYELCKGIPEKIFNELTDGCSVFTYYGEKVFMAEGSTKNIKITYPEDIKKAELFLKDE